MVATAAVLEEIEAERSDSQKRADRKFAQKKSLIRKVQKQLKREERTEALLKADLTSEERQLIELYRDGVSLDTIGKQLKIGDRRAVAVKIKRLIDKHTSKE